jgi:hypothetical protein
MEKVNEVNKKRRQGTCVTPLKRLFRNGPVVLGGLSKYELGEVAKCLDAIDCDSLRRTNRALAEKVESPIPRFPLPWALVHVVMDYVPVCRLTLVGGEIRECNDILDAVATGHIQHIFVNVGKTLVLDTETAQKCNTRHALQRLETICGATGGSACLRLVGDMSRLFAYTERFDADPTRWVVDEVTNMHGMFCHATAFDGDLSTWQVERVTDMSQMFAFARTFRGGGVSEWNVCNVTDMNRMFASAHNFDGNLAQWSVGKVTNMTEMFAHATAYHGEDLFAWDVSQVENMSYMFYKARKFRDDLSEWQVHNVIDMRCMFGGASVFESDLNQWEVGAVENMCDMFKGTRVLEDDLRDWTLNSYVSLCDLGLEDVI